MDRSRSRHSRKSFLSGALLSLIVLGVAACENSSPSDNEMDNDDGDGGGTGGPMATVVSGEITHDGAGVGSVVVTLQNGPAANREIMTQNDGAFEFDDVEPGSWELLFEPPAYFEMAPGQAALRMVTVVEAQESTVNATLSPVAADARVDIDMAGTSFTPNDVTIAPGTSVRWTVSSGTHTITPEDHSEWSSQNMNTGAMFEVVMNNPGDFDYFCIPHQSSGMTGVIHVDVP